jgi:hypothetical protein
MWVELTHMATITALLASERLKADVTQWIAERRDEGLSWSRISIALYEATGLVVTGQSLRTWSLQAAA